MNQLFKMRGSEARHRDRVARGSKSDGLKEKIQRKLRESQPFTSIELLRNCMVM